MSWRAALGVQTLSAEPAKPAQPRFGEGSAGCAGSAPTIETANVGASTPTRDPSRWHRFKAMCIERGVMPDELAEHFPSAEDREDIACSADDALETFAAHIARAVLAERASSTGSTQTAGSVDGVAA